MSLSGEGTSGSVGYMSTREGMSTEMAEFIAKTKSIVNFNSSEVAAALSSTGDPESARL